MCKAPCYAIVGEPKKIKQVLYIQEDYSVAQKEASINLFNTR